MLISLFYSSINLSYLWVMNKRDATIMAENYIQYQEQVKHAKLSKTDRRAIKKDVIAMLRKIDDNELVTQQAEKLAEEMGVNMVNLKE